MVVLALLAIACHDRKQEAMTADAKNIGEQRASDAGAEPAAGTAPAPADAVARRERLRSLVDSRSPRAPEALEAATRDPEPEVRGEAAVLVGEIEHPRALELLVALSKDPSPVVRAGAVIGLGVLPEQKGLEAILELVGDSDPLVRNDAMAALQPMKGAAAREAIERLSRDPVESVASAARQTLARRRKWGLDPSPAGEGQPGPTHE
jgi:HEAT repeat protein